MSQKLNLIAVLALLVIVGGFVFLIGRYGWLMKGQESALVELRGEKFVVSIADTPAERTAGLAGRSDLAENEGMLFLFEEPGYYGFWMRGMLMPIDIIWLKDKRVVGFGEAERPLDPDSFTLPIYYPPEPVNQVLEVKSGTIRRLGVDVGDEVSISL
jgi:uncharacterized membrane protein (UPF0127 family)